MGTCLDFFPHSNIRHITISLVITKNVNSQAPICLLLPDLNVATFDRPVISWPDAGIISAEDGPVADFAAYVIV